MGSGSGTPPRPGQLTGGTAWRWLLTCWLLLAACADDLPRYNEIDKLRVLAVQAEPPDSVMGESARLRALVVDPQGRRLDYAWSWCPLTAGSPNGFACVVDDRALLATWQAAGLPGEPPSLDLGDGTEAAFSNALSAQAWQALCKALVRERLPVGVAPPTCEHVLTIAVRLVVRVGDERIVTIKGLPVLLDPDPARNRNPEPRDLRIAGAARPLLGDAGGAAGGDAGVDPDADAGADTAAPVVAPEPDNTLLGRRHTLRADVPTAQAERFEPPAEPGLSKQATRRERLIATWFVTEGETDAQRTTFIDGEVPFAKLLENEWELPVRVESGEADVYFVLRDERGGTGWLSRRFVLEPEAAP